MMNPPIRCDQYVEGENVVAWLNKVGEPWRVHVVVSHCTLSRQFCAFVPQIGPYHNPQETYKYYTLPFCRPELKLTPAKKWAGWSEVFEGSEYLNSDLAIPFGRTYINHEQNAIDLQSFY